ncbi:MAG: hypothetical protein IJ677_01185 [Alphaproteobacteria bacterium]|nr:hypothetical protein [Alphaproteobacteria bacterium]
MSEKYFEYSLLLICGLSALIPLIWLYLSIKLKHLQKLSRIRVMKRQQKSQNASFFSSEILNDCCKKLFFSFDMNARIALASLIGGRIQKSADYFKDTHPQLSLLLQAHQNTLNSYKKMLKHKNVWLKNTQYCVYFPLLAHLIFDKKVMLSTIEKINPLKLNKHNKAYYNFCTAYSYLYDGDMLSASQKASAALEYFRKKKYSYEGSKCYLLLGEIYRLSCVNDVSQTMIEAAVKINQEQKMPQYLAQSTTSLGMLMLFENRYEEAEENFNKALQSAQTESLRAEIRNQKALLYIAQNKFKQANTEILKALPVFIDTNNMHGQAFSNQLSAQINFNKKQYSRAIKHADAAKDFYKKTNNFSAFLECLYLIADALFKQNKLKKSEEILRKMLADYEKQKHNFHIANAYSLLGLIYLRKKDLQRAKVLLQQSLHLEQRYRRCEGLVSDYTNLAIIDNLSGNTDNAKNNLQTALEYAEQTGNTELISIIKKKFNDFT